MKQNHLANGDVITLRKLKYNKSYYSLATLATVCVKGVVCLELGDRGSGEKCL